MNSDVPVSIRLNPFKRPASELPILEGSVPVPWSPYGRILSERPLFTLHPLFHAGVYYVQDSSAMYVGHVLRKHMKDYLPQGGKLRILDLCAAPGGKTTDISASARELCGEAFELVSNEVMKQRVGVLADNVARWGDPAVTVTSADPAAFARLEGYFDIIVADVPCSGEGMFRKDPRAEAEWSPAVVELCAARQKRILADMWPSLREGGLLVYSTCTYEAAENDDNLKWAAAELGGEILPPEDEFAASGVRLTECGNLLKAGEVPGEGQWVGAMRKTAAAGCTRKGLTDVIRPYKTEAADPDPDLPLRMDFDRNSYPCVDVDKQTALHFLHRDALVIPGAPLGYLVLTYRGVPLGFVKNIGKRCNNLLPKGRRILMNV